RNVYGGIFAEYANFGWEPSEQDPPVAERPLLDRWVLSRLRTVELEADRLLGEYDATEAVNLLTTFVIEDVSNWYVRQSRARFYDVSSADNRAAFATLHEVLVVTSRLLAPLAPFVSDWLHRELTGESVHLASYVRAGARDAGVLAVDAALEVAMAEVRELARLGRAAREEAGIRVRQPLSRVVCVVPPATPAEIMELLPLLAAELNVKRVEMATSADALVTLEGKANFRVLGKKFGKRTPDAAAAINVLSSSALRQLELGEEVTIELDGERHAVAPEDVSIQRRATGDLVVQEAGGSFAALDPVITPQLRGEGLARELVSRVQRMRKETGLAVSDRIRLWVDGDAAVLEAAEAHREWIAEEVLARALVVGAMPADESNHAARDVELDGLHLRVALTRES
ncbi:MAG TPA: DUF5915 domain-containing protein, partial [Gemmatimonadaceae bacterium]|nr:DUF5915 domain-containing protein [Gemmatimonadaceae bacterium]